MRRLALIGLFLAGTAACSYSSGNLAYQSTLFEPTRGVALRGASADPYRTDGMAQVGMNGTTCVVDVAWAGIGNDYDYPGVDEVVQANGNLDGQNVVVVTSDVGVHVQHGTDWDVTSDDYPVTGVQQASLAGGDVATLVDNGIKCQVDWVGADSRQVLESGTCGVPYSLDADPATGDAFVGSSHGVLRVSPGHSEVLTDKPSQLIAWDATSGVLYTATRGDSLLTAMAGDGSHLWSVDLGASILDLDDMGTLGSAAVTLQHDDGTGGLMLVSGLDGTISESLDTPSAVPAISGSPDGRSLALVDADQVHFYKVSDPFGSMSTDGTTAP